MPRSKGKTARVCYKILCWRSQLTLLGPGACLARRSLGRPHADLLVAPMTTTRSEPEATPSNWTRNSVFSRRLASCSPELRSDKMLSISSALGLHRLDQNPKPCSA